MKQVLTNEQFNALLTERLFLNFELSNEWGQYCYYGEDILIIEGKEMNVEADVAIELKANVYLHGVKPKDIDITIRRIIDDECNEYELTPEQEKVFEKHFKSNISEATLIFPAYNEPIFNYEYPIFN